MEGTSRTSAQWGEFLYHKMSSNGVIAPNEDWWWLWAGMHVKMLLV